jgi:pimeloyl-ACP methyl ester carboxylesterase
MPFLKANGQEIYYEDSGGNGVPVIFMHGFLMNLRMFDPIRDILSPQYRIIAFDARTFGQTKWDGKSFNLYDTASDCIAVMNALGIEKAVIAGMSQGGYAALRLALKHPERVKALVLISTRSGTDEKEAKEAYTQVRDVWKNVGAVEEMLQGLCGAIIGSPDDEKAVPYREKWLPVWRQYSGENIFAGMNNLLERDEIDEHLKKIQHPALVLHGKGDSGVPAFLGEKLAGDLPNCRKIHIAGGAHAAIMTHVEEYADVLKDFLGSI